jgi:hypothetical protein
VWLFNSGQTKKALKDKVLKGVFSETKTIHKTGFIFFHPDYTVGTGISPVQSVPKTQSRGLYRRSGVTPRPENTSLC